MHLNRKNKFCTDKTKTSPSQIKGFFDNYTLYAKYISISFWYWNFVLFASRISFVS